MAEIINNNSKNLSLFEGVFIFLSFEKLEQINATSLTDFLVLISNLFFKKSSEIMKQHQKIISHLDSNSTSLRHLQNVSNWSKRYFEESQAYQGYKDLNEYLIYQGQQQNHGQALEKDCGFLGASYVLVIPKLLAPLMLRIPGELLMLTHSFKRDKE